VAKFKPANNSSQHYTGCAHQTSLISDHHCQKIAAAKRIQFGASGRETQRICASRQVTAGTVQHT
jgi:hypothetical protein